MVTTRQKQILESIVEEYIKKAKPVSSQSIEKKYKFGVCPATVRIEMQALTQEGYLFQPHTSAGRVPTDKGYRFFVDNLLEKEVSGLFNLLEAKEILEEEKDIFKWVSRLSKFLAKASSNFVISCLLERNFFFKEGWDEILKEPEFEDKTLMLSFAKFLENFEKNIQDLKVNSEVKIYIGKENPFKKGKDFGVILAKCHFPEKEEGIISILGPKRMAYERNINLINALTELLEEI